MGLVKSTVHLEGLLYKWIKGLEIVHIAHLSTIGPLEGSIPEIVDGSVMSRIGR